MVNTQKEGVSRRGFFAAVGAGLAGSALTAVGVGTALAEDGAPSRPGAKAILFNAAKCANCHYCEAECAKANSLGCAVEVDKKALFGKAYPKELMPGELSLVPGLAPIREDDRSADRWLRTVTVKVTQGEDKVDLPLRRSCVHCGLCADVCPAGALTRREDGAIEVKPERCIGCKYCYQACPFDIPRYNEVEGDKTIRKCTMCATVTAEGGTPACVGACAAEALQYGTFDELMKTAASQAAALQKAGYKDACVYGAKELGGCSVITVLPYSRKACGLPKLPC